MPAALNVAGVGGAAVEHAVEVDAAAAADSNPPSSNAASPAPAAKHGSQAAAAAAAVAEPSEHTVGTDEEETPLPTEEYSTPPPTVPASPAHLLEPDSQQQHPSAAATVDMQVHTEAAEQAAGRGTATASPAAAATAAAAAAAGSVEFAESAIRLWLRRLLYMRWQRKVLASGLFKLGFILHCLPGELRIVSYGYLETVIHDRSFMFKLGSVASSAFACQVSCLPDNNSPNSIWCSTSMFFYLMLWLWSIICCDYCTVYLLLLLLLPFTLLLLHTADAAVIVPNQPVLTKHNSCWCYNCYCSA
jgi:hypothetical protein